METDIFQNLEIPIEELWHKKVVREIIQKEWQEFIKIRQWTSFITLTFRDEKPYDQCIKEWMYLVRLLNEKLFGKHYTKIVGHSYFSYVRGIEYQTRGVLHFHVLIDRPVDFRLIHNHWALNNGHVWTTIVKNQKNVINYVSKYAIKDGEIDLFVTRVNKIPLLKPFYWNEQMMMMDKEPES